MQSFKFKSRNRLTAEELSAYRNAYEGPLTKNNYLFYIGMPALVLGGFLFYLTYCWYLALPALIVGALYGWQFLLPKSIMRKYQILSFNERNRLINLLTQQVTDKSKIPKTILERVTKRIEGELYEDFSPITSKIANGSTNREIKAMFEVIKEKYIEDIIFTQYLEQLETNFSSGIDNLDTLKDMTVYHNDLREKRDVFIRYKVERLKDFRLLTIIFVVLISALEFGFGFERYINAFANSIIGKIDSVIYVLAFAFIFISFFNYFFDDSITEVVKY